MFRFLPGQPALQDKAHLITVPLSSSLKDSKLYQVIIEYDLWASKREPEGEVYSKSYFR